MQAASENKKWIVGGTLALGTLGSLAYFVTKSRSKAKKEEKKSEEAKETTKEEPQPGSVKEEKGPEVPEKAPTKFLAHNTTFTNANFPLDSEGRTLHLNIKRGDVANRILSVGSPSRGLKISSMLDKGSVREVPSTRGFHVFTGTFNGVPISIVVTGMGIPMIDFVVREVRSMVDGDIAMMRLGTCGGVPRSVVPGNVVVAGKGSTSIHRNPNAFGADSKEEPYIFHNIVMPDAELSQHVLTTFQNNETLSSRVLNGLNCTADSFYSSQGRTDEHFDDRNGQILDELETRFPEISTLEMESFHLFDVARCSRSRIRTAAACIVLAQRRVNDFLPNDIIEKLEAAAGLAALQALTSFNL